MFAALMAPAYGRAVDYARPPAEPRPPLSFDVYTGTYTNDLYGDVEIAVEGGGLVLRQGPHRLTAPLRHWDRDVFLYQPVGENAGGPSAVTFQVGPGPMATQVVIENLDIFGQGAFTRAAPGR